MTKQNDPVWGHLPYAEILKGVKEIKELKEAKRVQRKHEKFLVFKELAMSDDEKEK